MYPSRWRLVTHRKQWKPVMPRYLRRGSLAQKAYVTYARKRAKYVQHKLRIKRFLRKVVRKHRMYKAGQAAVRRIRGW